MQIQPYPFFEGRTEEALAFYQTALGAEVTMLMRFDESPEPGHIPPGGQGKVMHASFTVAGNTIMASDGRCSGAPGFDGFALSLAPADAAQADRLFTALAAGGQVLMPLGKTFWSPAFGMVKDRFGVTWMVNLEP
ncbi:MAG: VOC family protein [Acetobacteraceae bacterium]|nr:VOC family protein [Acetobacteraceae bacterium]